MIPSSKESLLRLTYIFIGLSILIAIFFAFNQYDLMQKENEALARELLEIKNNEIQMLEEKLNTTNALESTSTKEAFELVQTKSSDSTENNIDVV